MQSIRSRMIYNLLKLIGSPFKESTPLTAQREYLEKQSRFAILSSKVVVERTSIGEMYAEWIRPPSWKNQGVILYLHGGGYTMGSCNTHRALVARIALASQTAAIQIAYRLAPDYPYPAALDDSIDAFHYLLEQGIPPSKIIVAGDSAGGGLAVALALVLREENEQLPGGIVCISPWADLTMSGESMFTCSRTDPMLTLESCNLHTAWYVGQHDQGLPRISPVFADLKSFPPMFIQAGEHEILRSDAERLADHARQAGTEVTLEIWEGMWHLWHAYAGYMPEAQRAIDRIGAFIEASLNAE